MTEEPPLDAFTRYLEETERDLPERDRNPGRPRPPASGWGAVLAWALLLAGIVAVLAIALPAWAGECAIKGNISRSGTRIYHPPSSPAYGSVVIDPAKGERMFCSEEEALAAGWRPVKGRELETKTRPMENPFK